MDVGTSPDGLASAFEYLCGDRVKRADVYDRKWEHTIWFMIEIVVIICLWSGDVVCPTCFRTWNVAVEIMFSVGYIQRSDDLDTCSACVCSEFLIDVLMSADAVILTYICGVVVVCFLEKCYVM